MCGRYSQTHEIVGLRKRFRFETLLDLIDPRYNIAPSQEAPVIILKGSPKLEMLRWGLVPFWAKDEKIGNRMINARSETIAQKPAFRKPFKKNRCLVIADGFYEWVKPEGQKSKQPYRFVLKDGGPFAFPGLWDEWKNPDNKELIRTFTILTAEADEWMKQYHHRMPVVLRQEDEGTWLDLENQDQKKLLSLLGHNLESRMEAYPVSTVVNFPGNDSEACIEPV